MNEALLLFAKRPLRGKVKTRLEPRLGPDDALALYRAMLLDALDLVRSREAPGRRLEACFDAAWDPPEPFASAVGGLRVTAQGPGDLGARLARAARRLRDEGAAVVVFVGADSPTLDPVRIDEAYDVLTSGAGAAFAPSEDGGYVLVGCRLDRPGLLRTLFHDVPWGGPAVAATTRRRLDRAGVAWHELAPGRDVDDPEDLVWLRAILAHDGTARGRAPRTARWIAASGGER